MWSDAVKLVSGEAPGSSPRAASSVSRPFLQIEDLGKSYVPGREAVFEQVNFSIERGEFVCIVGHSGCGKTTILNVLA
ncbi:MAG: ATP-binding cassette domain-containing protein, partial [Steroidobacteraceae bacterium]